MKKVTLLVKNWRQRLNFFPYGTSPYEVFQTYLALGSLLLFTTLNFINLSRASFYQRQLSERTAHLAVFAEKMGRFRTLESEYATLEKEIYLLEKALPNSLDTPQFLNKISLIFGKNRLTLTGVKLEKTNTGEKKPYATLLINLDFQGSYQETSQTLEDLEKDEQQFDMQSLLLRRPLSGARLEGSLRLKTYFYRNGEGS